jgi:hypothetical protein
MHARGNSRSATATPTGSPKRRLPQVPTSQGLGLNRAQQFEGGQQQQQQQQQLQQQQQQQHHRLRGAEGGLGGGAGYHSSYDGGLNNGRGHNLQSSNRSRSMGHASNVPYGGGYSDTEVMAPSAANNRYYNDAHAQQQRGYAPPPHDPYYENTRTGGGQGGVNSVTAANNAVGGQQGGVGGYPEDRRAQPPPPPPRNVNFEGDPPTRGSGGPRKAPPIHGARGRSHNDSTFVDSDMESVTSAFSSHSAPHQRSRRPG